MLKKIALVAIALVLSTHAVSSGERALELSPQRISELPELEANQVSEAYHYIGRYQEWQLFGETLTTSDGDMPFSSTYGYRVAADSVEVINGRALALSKLPRWIDVETCPAIISVIAEQEKHRIVVAKTEAAC